MNTLIIVGNDSWGRVAAAIAHEKGFTVAYDESSSLKRVLRLVSKKVLPPSLILKMFMAEIRRTKTEKVSTLIIKNNNDISTFIKNNGITKLVLFRAGLIINKNVLNSGVEVLNIHCAKLPEFGGIGTISKALGARAYNQEATLHKVTERIDSGEVFDIEKYTLDPKASYKANEDTAYTAGLTLLKRTLDYIAAS
jgi:folate-dependent phosphoribosylglycinamide formyltransferase PurN